MDSFRYFGSSCFTGILVKYNYSFALSLRSFVLMIFSVPLFKGFISLNLALIFRQCSDLLFRSVSVSSCLGSLTSSIDFVSLLLSIEIPLFGVRFDFELESGSFLESLYLIWDKSRVFNGDLFLVGES